jgi:hypothetical protein
MTLFLFVLAIALAQTTSSGFSIVAYISVAIEAFI